MFESFLPLGGIKKGLTMGKALNGIGKTLNIANQLIPIYKEAKPLFNNAKSLLKIANSFKETPQKKNKIINNNANTEISTKLKTSPTSNLIFFQ